MFVLTFLLRITHIIIPQSIADSSWITLYMCHMLTSQVRKEQFNTSINNSKWYYGCNWHNYNNTIPRKRVLVEPSRRTLQSISTQPCYTLSYNRNKIVPFILSFTCPGFIPVSRGILWTTYSWYLGLTFANVDVCKLYITPYDKADPSGRAV